MAAPERQPLHGDDLPSTDLRDTVLAYRREKARRHARARRQRERRLAHFRFYGIMLVLVLALVALLLGLLHELQGLFGV
jgi:type VI protein secretion system component VasF